MKQIHNTKERMPLILDTNEAKKWISSDLTKEEIQAHEALKELQMASHCIGRLINSLIDNSNICDVEQQEKYPELSEMI